MTGSGTELAMMALVIMIMALIFAIVWFVFMVPMEKGLHKRRMQLIQQKLRNKEEQRRRESREAAGPEPAPRTGETAGD